MKELLIVFLFCIAPSTLLALDNGLALTPPMGWLSWERFTCNIDCKNDPENCISEKLYMEMAERMVADGYKDAGYEYINVDDCWMDMNRDSSDRLKPDPVRFPSGIKALADYVHSKGLKLGIYTDCGNKTCAGYPGSLGYFDVDAKTFADWGIDMLKVDGCYAEPTVMDDLYPQITVALNQSGRPIVFSCSWPAYQVGAGIDPDYAAIAQHCNLWRNFDDIEDSWDSVLSIVDFYAAHQDELVAAAGPGHWNDPDMILGGNFGLSYDEARAQFALWAIMASPLLMSNDLRSIEPKFKALLLNKDVIAVNQDPLGIMGKRIYNNNKVEIWSRPISPVNKSGKYSFALVFFNRRTLGGPVSVSANIESLGLDNVNCYDVRDLFSTEASRKYCPSDNITLSVNPSGVRMVVAKIL
ncbi:alpha-N-acetylgalactosaminidase-like [Argiope bruennichi]|uniref:Alpha-galactosidase n=1 Tax=Argiope bruennichi TaxID=94029 RepID=A0A8T0FIS4_ARGBR|nr:alpha-N-acetylgalactosaminidase-like [Argiope bruennichi]XP_055929971.1 alpha-N-acetylgalactosaminidase-like [Argiope bruennichi]XP_055929972.1 alpha-N-acetylgalactosaminidase-like [Argiope bruennichi]XP_055929973.1 alpha-N-acetylgalactosaminidase-like [Argiope bruennichi]KAF8790285.1 Alpha-N-acetylgalactosaminidase like protein [Argiope bruennichi]